MYLLQVSSSLLLIWSLRDLNLQRETQAFTITSITCYYARWKRKLGGSFISKLLLWPKNDVACVRAQPPSRVRLCHPMDCSLPGFFSMKFPRQEYWSRLPFPSPECLPNPGIKSKTSALTGGFFTTEPPGKPKCDKGFHSNLCPELVEGYCPTLRGPGNAILL